MKIQNYNLYESGKSSIEALRYCKMILKSFKNPSFRRSTASSGIIIPDDAVDRRKLGFLNDFIPFYSSVRPQLNFCHFHLKCY